MRSPSSTRTSSTTASTSAGSRSRPASTATPSVADVGTGYIDIAISDGPDPTLGWGVFSIGYADALPDFPGIGTSTDKVVVSTNVFALVPGGGMGCEPDDASFLGTEMDVMAWSELIGTGTINIDFLNSINDFANDFFSWRPSLQTPASSPTVFVVSETSTNDVAYARITGTPAGGGVTSISAPANLSSILTGFGDPPAPQQPGRPARRRSRTRSTAGRPTRSGRTAASRSSRRSRATCRAAPSVIATASG